MTKPKAKKPLKAWAIMYHDNPDKIWRSFGNKRFLIYEDRATAEYLSLGPVRAVEIRQLPSPRKRKVK